MSIKKHAFKTIGTSWLSLIVVSLSQLIMIPVALAHLDKTDFALFAIITQVFMSIMLAEMGVRSATARLLIDASNKDNKNYDKVWMAACAVFAFQAVMIFVLTIIIAPFLGDMFSLSNAQRSTIFWIFLALGVKNTLGYVLSVFRTALIAGQCLHKINSVSMISSVVDLIGFCIFINLGFGLWAYPISAVITFIVSQPLIIRMAIKNNLVGRFNLKLLEWSEVKEILKLGIDVFAAMLFLMVMGNSLLIFSGYLLTLEETAVLAVNLKLVSMMIQILQRVPGSINPMLMKMVSQDDYSGFKQWWGYTAKLSVSLCFLGAGLYVFGSEWLIKTWTGKENMQMHGVSVLLLALVPARYIIHTVFVNSLAVFKEIRKVKYWLIWEVALYTAMAFWLGEKYGMVGLLSANLLSLLAGALFIGIKHLSFYSKIEMTEILWLLLRLIVPTGLLLGLFCRIFNYMQVTGLLGVMSISITWCAVFTLCMYLFILNGNDRLKCKQILNKALMKIR